MFVCFFNRFLPKAKNSADLGEDVGFEYNKELGLFLFIVYVSFLLLKNKHE